MAKIGKRTINWAEEGKYFYGFLVITIQTFQYPERELENV